jgi:hypothetical protein
MLKLLLSFFGGPVIKGLVDSYRAKLDAANKTDKIAADLAAIEIEAQIKADAEAASIVRVEQGKWYTAIVRPLFAAPFVIYAWKVVVYDKVLGLGTTDPLQGLIGEWAGAILLAYFGGRTLEKISRSILSRR